MSSGATLMKTKSSRAGAMFMKGRAPELCHFYDGSTALIFTACFGIWYWRYPDNFHPSGAETAFPHFWGRRKTLQRFWHVFVRSTMKMNYFTTA